MSLIGERFGRWVVESEGEPYIAPNSNHTKVRYNCKCDCGSKKLVREDTLIKGESTSCGCYAKEQATKRLTTHGLGYHILYSTYIDMVRRCTDPRRKDYKHYGGRGISVCPDWLDKDTGLAQFITDMLPTYLDGLELDRIDVNGNYCKENCKWVTHREQVINRRSFGSVFDTKFITYMGKTLCISQWADETGIPYKVLIDRLGKLKWSVEKALTTPKRCQHKKKEP